LKLAEAFTDKTRGYEEAFNLIDSGEGKKSEGLFVCEWRNQDELNAKIEDGLNKVFDFEEIYEIFNRCIIIMKKTKKFINNLKN